MTSTSCCCRPEVSRPFSVTSRYVYVHSRLISLQLSFSQRACDFNGRGFTCTAHLLLLAALESYYSYALTAIASELALAVAIVSVAALEACLPPQVNLQQS